MTDYFDLEFNLATGCVCSADPNSNLQNGEVAGARTIAGAVSNFTPGAQSTYLTSMTVTAIGGNIIYNDAFGNTKTLRDGQTDSWSSDGTQPLTPPTNFQIPAGVEMDLIWTEAAL